jgi:Flp pilus assembly protein TadD
MAPDQPEPLLGIGDTAAAMGASRTAAEAYERVLRLRPQSAAARIGYGLVLLDLDEADAALGQCREALRLGARDPRLYNALGVALDLLGRHDEAQAAYSEGIVQEAENIALRNNMALSLALGGQFDAAIERLRILVQEPEAGGRVRQNLALVYALAGQTQNAAVVARQDLSEHEVANNLAFYESLRGLSGRPLAEAVFRGQVGDARLQLQQEIPPAAL